MKMGEKKGSARGSVHLGCDYATALDIEVDPQRRCLAAASTTVSAALCFITVCVLLLQDLVQSCSHGGAYLYATDYRIV